MSTTNKKSQEAEPEATELDTTIEPATAGAVWLQDLASLEELKELVTANEAKEGEVVEDIDDRRQEASAQRLRERETHRRGEEEYYKLRNKWSWFIFIFIAFMLLFQLFLTVAIGYRWLNFEDYPVFLHLVIGENFAQIIGMGFIVAKFLFPYSRQLKDNKHKR